MSFETVFIAIGLIYIAASLVAYRLLLRGR
ncbi:hypothetical protein GGQ79_000923 [Ochrobactrum pecoris]|uniref:Cation:proton antiporter n=1 Tax=Brucella pecoris TaxID=867683 RepID=A0AB34YRU6_9HYPH|nr:hypothetical protein [Brucella pecoris]